MIHITCVRIPHGTKQLKRQPFLLDVFEERTSTIHVRTHVGGTKQSDLPQAVIERAIEVLSYQIAIRSSFQDSLVSDSVRHVSQ